MHPSEHIQHCYAEYNSEEEHGVGRTPTADLSFPAFSLVSARLRSFMFQVSIGRSGSIPPLHYSITPMLRHFVTPS
jgi:hypothetical protein